MKNQLKYCFKLICVSVHKSGAQNLHVLLPPVGVGAIQNTPRQSVALSLVLQRCGLWPN
jgi:hypothetical protein